MQIDTLLGSIMIWPLDWVPEGYHLCDGSILSTRENQALFSILSNKYGGDGITTFALPDLRGRVVVGFGQGHGLSAHPISETGGVETVSLTSSQMPNHTHSLMASKNGATISDPTNAVLANSVTIDGLSGSSLGNPIYIDMANAGNLVSTNPANVSSIGGGQAHTNMQPYLTLNFIIATDGGTYPIRKD